jgi:hypothetical protein
MKELCGWIKFSIKTLIFHKLSKEVSSFFSFLPAGIKILFNKSQTSFKNK